jgi:type II secretory pathway pseudopilin PulG
MDGTVTRRGSRQAGFTLVELSLAAGLATLVILTLSYVMVPLVRAQVLAVKSQSVQLNLSAALKTADREISQASWLRAPSQAGGPSELLEGCANAAPPSDGVAAAPLDPSRPMRWFALCPANGILYYHAGEGCPPVYTCGVAPTSSFAGGSASRTVATFTRASPLTTVVEIVMTMTNGEASGSLRSAAAFSGAAGTGQ